MPIPTYAIASTTTSSPLQTNIILSESISTPSHTPTIQTTSQAPILDTTIHHAPTITTPNSTVSTHTTLGPQLVSTISKISTIGAPLTTTTFTTDTLTKQEIQEIDIVGTSQQVGQESIDKAHGFQEPRSLFEAAQMAQLYMTHMLNKAQEMQEEELNLHEELGHL